MGLPVKLKQPATGSDIINALENAAKDMGLETKIINHVSGVQLCSIEIEVESDVFIKMPYFGGRFKNPVACIPGISRKKNYNCFSFADGFFYLIGPNPEDLNWKKLLGLVSKYLDQSASKQSNN